jgi:pimeloyl-ACP methyl ester carboxylesterase
LAGGAPWDYYYCTMTADRFETAILALWNGDNVGAISKFVQYPFVLRDIHTGRMDWVLHVDVANTYRSLMPNFCMCIESVTSRSRSVHARWTGIGTHTGHLLGAAPTGRAIRISGELQFPGTPSASFAAHADSLYVANATGLGEGGLVAALNLPTTVARARVTGSGHLPSVVLVPTMALPGWQTWARLVRALAARRSVFASQLLATRHALIGDTPSDSYSVAEELAAFARALSDTRLEPPFHLVAHSIGCVLALEYASVWPSRCLSLTLVEPTVPWVARQSATAGGYVSRFLAHRDRAYQATPSVSNYTRFIRYTLKHDYDPVATATWPSFLMYRGNLAYRRAFLSHTPTISVSHITCPVLLVNGDRSDRFFLVVTDRLREELPATRHVTLPGGHCPHTGAGHDAFLRLLTAFFAESERAHQS